MKSIFDSSAEGAEIHGTTLAGSSWGLRLWSPGSSFGGADFTNSVGDISEGFWIPTNTGLCQSYDGRQNWVCHSLHACMNDPSRVAMRNAEGNIYSIVSTHNHQDDEQNGTVNQITVLSPGFLDLGLSQDLPDFRSIIDGLDYIGAAEKAVMTELLQTAFTLIGGMEPGGTAALLGISAENFVAEFVLDPQAMLSVVGTDIIVSAGEAAFAGAAGDLVASYMFASGPLSELPNEWQVPLRAFVDATIIESVGLLAIGTDPTGASLVGPIVDRFRDVYEIYLATNALSRTQATGLFAVANGAEITSELVLKHPGDRAEALRTDWFAMTRENLRDIVGADDAAAAYIVTVRGYRALVALGLGDTDAARAEVELMRADGDAAEGFTPLSAEGPIDLLVRIASGGHDAPRLLVETFLTSTALVELESEDDAPNLEPQAESTAYGPFIEINGVTETEGAFYVELDRISTDVLIAIFRAYGASPEHTGPSYRHLSQFDARRQIAADEEYISTLTDYFRGRRVVINFFDYPINLGEYNFNNEFFNICGANFTPSLQDNRFREVTDGPGGRLSGVRSLFLKPYFPEGLDPSGSGCDGDYWDRNDTRTDFNAPLNFTRYGSDRLWGRSPDFVAPMSPEIAEQLDAANRQGLLRMRNSCEMFPAREQIGNRIVDYRTSGTCNVTSVTITAYNQYYLSDCQAFSLFYDGIGSNMARPYIYDHELC